LELTRFYFPRDDPDLEGILSFSPLDTMICPIKPFGDISAEEYLDFAREGFKQGTRAGLINALANAKRCFHYQTDKLLFRFGLRKATAPQKYPEKIDLLNELRIVSGALLRSFNRERNIMEHDYIAPSKNVVEGSIDLCELFLLATKRYLINVPAKIRVTLSEDERDLILMLIPGDDHVRSFAIHGSKITKTENGEIYTTPLSKIGSEQLSVGLKLEPLPNEDIPIRLDNKERWLRILRMFSNTVWREVRYSNYPDEPMMGFTRYMPLRDAQKMFRALYEKPS